MIYGKVIEIQYTETSQYHHDYNEMIYMEFDSPKPIHVLACLFHLDLMLVALIYPLQMQYIQFDH